MRGQLTVHTLVGRTRQHMPLLGERSHSNACHTRHLLLLTAAEGCVSAISDAAMPAISQAGHIPQQAVRREAHSAPAIPNSAPVDQRFLQTCTQILPHTCCHTHQGPALKHLETLPGSCVTDVHKQPLEPPQVMPAHKNSDG